PPAVVLCSPKYQSRDRRRREGTAFRSSPQSSTRCATDSVWPRRRNYSPERRLICVVVARKIPAEVKTRPALTLITRRKCWDSSHRISDGNHLASGRAG